MNFKYILSGEPNDICQIPLDSLWFNRGGHSGHTSLVILRVVIGLRKGRVHRDFRQHLNRLSSSGVREKLIHGI